MTEIDEALDELGYYLSNWVSPMDGRHISEQYEKIRGACRHLEHLYREACRDQAQAVADLTRLKASRD